MADRKPLVIVDGQAQELPAGDTLATPLKTINGQDIHGVGDIVLSGADSPASRLNTLMGIEL